MSPTYLVKCVLTSSLVNNSLMVSQNMRRIFHSMWIEGHHETFQVHKASESRGRVWDRRLWEIA
jgi:hypothetical protein